VPVVALSTSFLNDLFDFDKIESADSQSSNDGDDKTDSNQHGLVLSNALSPARLDVALKRVNVFVQLCNRKAGYYLRESMATKPRSLA
jgi:hypothetical protein